MGYEDLIQNIKIYATVEIAKTNIDFGKRLILLLTKVVSKNTFKNIINVQNDYCSLK